MDEQNDLLTVLKKFGRKHSVTVQTDSDFKGEIDLVISGGGDGTFLDAARKAFLHGVPVAGINIGHMGFLTEINPEEETLIENLFKGDFTVKTRMMIDVSVLRKGKVIFKYTALNEAMIHREAIAGMICFGIKYNGEHLPEYRADGILISTPTGSTAYNLSCNGPIIYPTDNSLVINAIAPHALTHRPIVLPAQGMIEAFLKDCGKGVISCDGHNGISISENDIIKIRKSPKKLLFVSNPDRSFFDILSQKLHFGRRL